MNIEAMLAEMRVEIRYMREDIAEMKEEQNARQDKADESRARVHQRLDIMTERVGALEGSHRSMTGTVSDMQEITDEVRRWKIMGMTSLSIAGVGAAAFGVTFSDTIRWAIKALLGK
ncbi:hypothetical protein ACO34A_03810 [Rhizobium sp. ACO-34A]|nr:DUF1515 family protein [Rhizobium sp. ACO-34A]ATN32926.1 hypothetical protein ACO34A_03810 [Rhizobium sp. ACO-34A]